jgi:alpha-galactosidase
MPMITEQGGLWQLQADGVCLLLDARGPGCPTVVHWGAALEGEADLAAVVAGLRSPARHDSDELSDDLLSVLPQQHRGYPGRPGMLLSRRGRGEPELLLVGVREVADGVVVETHGWDDEIVIVTTLRLDDFGVLRLQHKVSHHGSDEVQVDELGLLLPVASYADEIVDTTGRWALEQQPQRRQLDFGTWLRETRRGRTGHDASLLMTAGVGPVRNRSGECWGLHLGWSGDQRSWVERWHGFAPVIGAAELLGPGEVVLRDGASYETPVLYAVWSDRGLDGLSSRLHRHLRSRPTHPARPRPVTLNTWEAVYFGGDLASLSALADKASGVGVERFVLDDGWFRGRRDDRAGLGDWFVDEQRWPEGLRPLAEHVRSCGLELGLWVEPEMVNADSDLFRAHPGWALRVDGRLPTQWRRQYALDLQRDDVFAYLLERLTSLVGEYELGYLKWDHNRDVFGVDHEGRPAMHGQTLALYQLIDQVKAAFPALEIESCSSGGGRVDLGILARTDRVWASDTIDALDRVGIQRWTSLLLPPELMGSHIGGPQAHTTGRRHDLSFRFAVALLSHLGIEWDLTQVPDDGLAALASCVAFACAWRPLIHGGELVHADLGRPGADLTGVVSADGRQALYVYAQLASPQEESATRTLLPGLDPAGSYLLEVHNPSGSPVRARIVPAWMKADSAVLPGTVLSRVGLPLPSLNSEQAVIFSATMTS